MRSTPRVFHGFELIRTCNISTTHIFLQLERVRNNSIPRFPALPAIPAARHDMYVIIVVIHTNRICEYHGRRHTSDVLEIHGGAAAPSYLINRAVRSGARGARACTQNEIFPSLGFFFFIMIFSYEIN